MCRSKFDIGDLGDRRSSRSTPFGESILDSAMFQVSICNLAILYGDQFKQNYIGEDIVEEKQQQVAY